MYKRQVIDTHEVMACFEYPDSYERLFKGTESDCEKYQDWVFAMLSAKGAQVIPNGFAPSPPAETAETAMATDARFTYTDRLGEKQTVALDVNAVLDARRCGVSWSHSNKGVTMRKRFGVVCTSRRFQEIRESLEWWQAVKAYAEANNLMNEEFLVGCLPKSRAWRYNDAQIENG